MKLYDVPNGSHIIVTEDAQIPPAAPNAEAGTQLFFDHIDGMYSYCTDSHGQVYHLAAWTEVEIVKELS